MIAQNAEKIIAARLRGMKPADMVIVALVQPLPVTSNPVVIADAGLAYDWRWVRDLNVCVHITSDIDWPNLTKDIAMQRPAHLELWDVAGQWGAHMYLVPTAEDVARPVRNWRYELDFLPWMDFQNQDYIAGRSYARDHRGVPYAVNL